MQNRPSVKDNIITAGKFCEHFELKKEARTLLLEGMTPREFAGVLIASKQYIAGIDFMAHALPPREAIWWGCLCLEHAYGNTWSAQEVAACKAAVAWVLQPNETSRAAADAPAKTAGPGSAAGRLATAAYLTGRSIASAGAMATPPPPFAAAKAVAGAVKLASTKAEPVKIADTQRLFVELGIAFLAGQSG